jgi:hypothetical protein
LLNLTTRAQIREHRIDSVLVDQTQTGIGNAQTDPAIFAFDPETAVLQVRQEPALGFVVGMGYIVPDHWAFARDLTYACHVDTPILINSSYWRLRGTPASPQKGGIGSPAVSLELDLARKKGWRYPCAAIALQGEASFSKA